MLWMLPGTANGFFSAPLSPFKTCYAARQRQQSSLPAKASL